MGVWVGNVYLFPVDWLMIVVALCIWPMALLLYFPIYLFSLWFVLFLNIFYNVNIVVCNSIDCIFMFLRFILWFHKLRLHFCFVFWLSLSLPFFFYSLAAFGLFLLTGIHFIGRRSCLIRWKLFFYQKLCFSLIS